MRALIYLYIKQLEVFVVYVRYVCQSEMKTELVGNIRIPDGKTVTIHTEIMNSLRNL